MFLQCEGFESLPLPPAVRAVAVEAAPVKTGPWFHRPWSCALFRSLRDAERYQRSAFWAAIRSFKLPVAAGWERPYCLRPHFLDTGKPRAPFWGMETRPRFSLEVLLSTPEALQVHPLSQYGNITYLSLWPFGQNAEDCKNKSGVSLLEWLCWSNSLHFASCCGLHVARLWKVPACQTCFLHSWWPGVQKSGLFSKIAKLLSDPCSM